MLPELRLPSDGILKIISRRKGPFACTAVIVIGLAALSLAVVDKRYYAFGSVEVLSPEPMPGSNAPHAETYQLKIGDPEDIESNLLAIASPRLIRVALTSPEAAKAIKAECDHERDETPIGRLITALYASPFLGGLLSRHSCEQVATTDVLALDWASKRYAVTSRGRSRIIAVGYTSSAPYVSQVMANLLIKTHLADEKDKRLLPRQASVAWLTGSIADLSASLQRDEAMIQEYRKSHGLLHGQFAPITAERLTEITKLLQNAEVAQATAEAQVAEVNKRDSVASVLDSKTIIDLKHELSLVSMTEARLTSLYNPDAPALIPVRQQKRDLQARIDKESAQIRTSLQATYRAATAQVGILGTFVDTIRKQAVDASDFETRIGRMVRDTDIKRTLYLEWSRQLSQMQTERESVTANSQLVNLAEVPLVPSFPRTIAVMLGGMMIGGFLGGIVALYVDRTDHKVRNLTVLRSFTDDDLLAVVPGVKRLFRHRSVADIAAQVGYHAPMQEAIRRIYVKLILANKKTILLTSSRSSEGKSATVLSLASFASQAGKRVVVLECDLRRPSFSKAYKLRPTGGGIIDFLNGTTNRLSTERVDGHEIVPAGRATLASTEVLSGQRFQELLDQFRDYDLILIDSPPCGSSLDASIMAPYVDGVIFCVRHGLTEYDQVRSSLAELKQAKGTVFGLAVTFYADAFLQVYQLQPRLADQSAA